VTQRALKEDKEHLESENENLVTRIKTLIDRAKSEVDTGPMNTLVENLNDLVDRLPRNSEIRKPLLASLTKRLTDTEQSTLLGIKQAMRYRLKKTSSAILQKYQAGAGRLAKAWL